MTSARDTCLARLFGFGVVFDFSVLLGCRIGLAQESSNMYTNPVSKDFAGTCR